MSNIKLIDQLPTSDKCRIELYDGLGFVELVEITPRLLPEGETVDKRIADAARTSYLGKGKSQAADNALVRRLLADKHTSPFEFVRLDFKMEIPLFVNQQLLRHRTASLNQASYRYVQAPDKLYYPSPRLQHLNNKQGSSDQVVDDQKILETWQEMKDLGKKTMEVYQKLLSLGVAREVARVGLPACLMTELVWTMNLHNLFHFLKLRMAEDAQLEIRQLATAMYTIIQGIIPAACEAFENYELNSIRFAKDELDMIQSNSIKLSGSKLDNLKQRLLQVKSSYNF